MSICFTLVSRIVQMHMPSEGAAYFLAFADSRVFLAIFLLRYQHQLIVAMSKNSMA